MKTETLLLLAGLPLAGWLLAGPLFKGKSLQAAGQEPPVPAAKLKCPVCGMFVDRHAAWRATIRFRDGEEVAFDGVKDLFNYLFGISRYSPGRTSADIQAIHVTDYYSLEQADAYRAHYVIGSDVLGPMGHELIPFAGPADAGEFLRDHHGKKILTFGNITRETISRLDQETGAGAGPRNENGTGE